MMYQVIKMINDLCLILTHSFLADTKVHGSDECDDVSVVQSTATLITNSENFKVNHALLAIL